VREYDEALQYYEAGLKIAPDIEKNKKIRSILINQI
jgi:hypothetical protein